MQISSNVTYSQYLSIRFSIRSGSANSGSINKKEIDPALTNQLKTHKKTKKLSELTKPRPVVGAHFLPPITTKCITLPHQTVKNLKRLNSSDLGGLHGVKTFRMTTIQSVSHLSQELQNTIKDISQAISSIIPIKDQEVILQTDNNPYKLQQPKFDWHWDFFEPTFRLFKAEKALPEFPHVFAYSGESFTPTEITQLPDIDIENYPVSFNQFKDDLKPLQPTSNHTRNRCQIISSKHLHRAPKDRDDDFLLIGVRSIHEKHFFERLSDHFIKEDAAKARLINPRHSYLLPIPAVFYS